MRAYTLPPTRSGWDASTGRGHGSSAAEQPLPLNLGHPAPQPFVARDAAIEEPVEREVPAAAPGAFFAGLSYIGQLDRTYLVCEGQGELILLDQHAAHERVAFQRLRVAHRQRGLARQRLLFPIPIEVDEEAALAARAPEAEATLSGLGFELEPFGAGTVLLRAVP